MEKQTRQNADHHDVHLRYFVERGEQRRAILTEKFGREVVDYVSDFADPDEPATEYFATTEYFNIEAVNGNITHTIVNIKRVNDIAHPSEFFAYVNRKLPRGGLFVCCVETLKMRRKRILNKFHPLIAYPYYFIDFIVKRIFPKMTATRRIYHLLTRGINRVMSMTETLGRLCACGFEIEDVRDIGYLTFIVAKKVRPAVYDGTKNCGLFIKLRRVGKDGTLFNVHKFRTMHPYAEYLQDYVHQHNSFTDGCKFKDDFRITSWGRVMRKFWIDELPMLVNLARGQMKLVGVRPLSEHYFSLYPQDFKKRRVQYRPGLVPPFYVDMPVTFDQVVESERKYLDAYDRSPFITDLRYFLLAFYNILIKRRRSA